MLDERYLSPQELADRLKVHRKTIIRRFEERSGVLKLRGPKGSIMLRIPESIAEAWIRENSQGFALTAAKPRGRQRGRQ